MPILNYSAAAPTNAYLSNNSILAANTNTINLLNKIIANNTVKTAYAPLLLRPSFGQIFPRFQR